MKRRYIIIAIVSLLVVTCLGFLVNYYTSTTLYTINYSNVTDVNIVEVRSNGTPPTISTLRHSGSTIRLSNEREYRIDYSGSDGYADGFYMIKPGTITITIDPDFSNNRYDEMIAAALPAVREAIRARYPRVNDLFSIDKGAMSQKGIWFTAWLTYRGEYNLNSDNLRVLLKLENNHWSLVTQPDIILTSINYPRVPVDILSWANSLEF